MKNDETSLIALVRLTSGRVTLSLSQIRNRILIASLRLVPSVEHKHVCSMRPTSPDVDRILILGDGHIARRTFHRGANHAGDSARGSRTARFGMRGHDQTRSEMTRNMINRTIFRFSLRTASLEMDWLLSKAAVRPNGIISRRFC